MLCHTHYREGEFSQSMRVDNSDDDSNNRFTVVTKYTLFKIMNGIFMIDLKLSGGSTVYRWVWVSILDYKANLGRS